MQAFTNSAILSCVICKVQLTAPSTWAKSYCPNSSVNNTHQYAINTTTVSRIDTLKCSRCGTCQGQVWCKSWTCICFALLHVNALFIDHSTLKQEWQYCVNNSLPSCRLTVPRLFVNNTACTRFCALMFVYIANVIFLHAIWPVFLHVFDHGLLLAPCYLVASWL